MFTGLVESTGTVFSVTHHDGSTRITVAAASMLVSRLRLGDSIAVSGVCLTALDLHPTQNPNQPARFSADLAQETLARTTLGHLAPNSTVNLELPTPAGAPLGGHVVQGHVDGTATLLALTALDPAHPATTDWRLRVELPQALTRYVVPQGSLTVEGISLTVASIHDRIIEIAIIPHTYASTSLRTLAPGSTLNIEVDVLSKYAEQQQPTEKPPQAEWLTAAYLMANGY